MGMKAGRRVIPKVHGGKKPRPRDGLGSKTGTEPQKMFAGMDFARATKDLIGMHRAIVGKRRLPRLVRHEMRSMLLKHIEKKNKAEKEMHFLMEKAATLENWLLGQKPKRGIKKGMPAIPVAEAIKMYEAADEIAVNIMKHFPEKKQQIIQRARIRLEKSLESMHSTKKEKKHALVHVEHNLLMLAANQAVEKAGFLEHRAGEMVKEGFKLIDSELKKQLEEMQKAGEFKPGQIPALTPLTFRKDFRS